MKVLQLYYKMPFPMNDGGAYSIYFNSLSLLGQGVELKILAMDLQSFMGDVKQIPFDFIQKTKFEFIPVDNRVKLFKALLNFFCSSSYFVTRFYSEKYCNRLIELLNSNQYDIIQLEHLYLAVYLPYIRKHSNAKVILRTQNVESLIWRRYLKNVNNPFIKIFISVALKRLSIFEFEVINNVNGIFTISPFDNNYFRKHLKHDKITVIPIGVDFLRFNRIDINKQYCNFPVLYHLGSMDWSPNVEGLKWFIKDVFPLLIKKYPDIKFMIAGKNMPKWFFNRKSANLIVEGTINDAIKFQEDKSILIVPLLSGSGIRVKILDGLAMGKTIVSTALGVEGIPVENNVNILIADSKEDFVRQISRAIESESLCRTIGVNAIKLAKDNFNIKMIGSRMFEFYNNLIDSIEPMNNL
jgi:glycosyltransferase involved in cell wall biosynthesis